MHNMLMPSSTDSYRVPHAVYSGTGKLTTVAMGYVDGDGDVTKETDADGQVTLTSFDALNHETGQQWYANATDAGIGITAADNVETMGYDLDGELRTASDDFSSYTFGYNSLGEETSVDNNGSGPSETTGTPGVPDVVLNSTFDAAGNRVGLTATIGGTADFVNTYSYDTLNRENQVTQGASTVSGHDAVDSKLVNFTYNADGQTASIDRFNDLTGSSGDRVATTAADYDDFGRLTSMAHTAANGTTTYAAYTWTYDTDSEVTSFTNAANIADYSNENIAGYTYDHDLQLTGATQESGKTANESNSLADSYDANGNTTNINGAGTTTVGAGNTVLFDGTYYDTYDPNGSLIEQDNSTNEIIDSYDNGKRLTSVVDKVFESGAWVKTEELDYKYDLFDDLLGRKDTTYESDGVTVAAIAIQRYVFDGKNTALGFDGNANLTDRFLSGPAVDQVLADEQFSLSGTNQLPTSAGNTLWALGDNQNSVRDVVDDSGTLEKHIAYSPFGQQTAQSSNPGSVVFVFGYTGTYTDSVTADQLHGVRWYDPASQRWLSQDPSGLGPDTNPYRYVGNATMEGTDPSGLKFFPSLDDLVERARELAKKLTGLDMPDLPGDAHTLGNWTSLFKVWFFEEGPGNSNLGDDATWDADPANGTARTTFGPQSPYSKDLFNSVGMKEIKADFAKATNDKTIGESGKKWPGAFHLTGAKTAIKGYLTQVEWFLGSYDVVVNYKKVKDSKACFDVDISAYNTSGWHSGTRLPPSWTQKIKDTIGISIEDLVSNAPRGMTLWTKLNSGIDKWNEQIDKFNQNAPAFLPDVPHLLHLPKTVTLPSFGGNWEQKFEMKGRWDLDQK